MLDPDMSSTLEPVGGFTTNVLYEESENGKSITYYLPCYLRFKIKNFVDVSLDGLNAYINGTIIFTLYYGDIKEEYVYAMKERIVFHFNRDEALYLKPSYLYISLTYKRKYKTLTYTIRKHITASIQSHVSLTPFYIIDLVFTIHIYSIKSLDLNEEKGKHNDKKVSIKFNCMDTTDAQCKLSYSFENKFGNYGLVETRLDCYYTNCRTPSYMLDDYNYEEYSLNYMRPLMRTVSFEAQSLGEDKIKNFQFAHFKIPLYKYPSVALITIFAPLWILGWLNLAIFFQDNGLGNRIAEIATLMIAFVALIPTIRDQIPPNPSITFIYILIYLYVGTSLLCLIDSFLNRAVDSTQVPYDYASDGFFIVSLIINVFSFITIVGMMIIHKLCWERSYVYNFAPLDKQLKRKEWSNIACDKYFSRFYRVKALPTEESKKKF